MKREAHLAASPYRFNHATLVESNFMEVEALTV